MNYLISQRSQRSIVNNSTLEWLNRKADYAAEQMLDTSGDGIKYAI